MVALPLILKQGYFFSIEKASKKKKTGLLKEAEIYIPVITVLDEVGVLAEVIF